MKELFLKTLVLFLITSCTNSEVEKTSPSINYFDNFEFANQESDNLEIDKVEKKYIFEFYTKTDRDSIRVFEIATIMAFEMFDIEGKNYLIPTYLSSNGFSSRKYYHNTWNVLIVKTDRHKNIEFELEFCFQIAKEKDIKKDADDGFIGKKIVNAVKKLNDSQKQNQITILANQNNRVEVQNIFCRKFNFSKEENNLIVRSPDPEKKLNPNDLIEFGTIEIKESGNMLDTVFLTQEIWDEKGRIYIEE